MTSRDIDKHLEKAADFLLWFKEFKNEQTSIKYSIVLKQFSEHVKSIAENPTPEEAIISYVLMKRKEGMATSTTKYRLSVLKSFFEWIGVELNKKKIYFTRDDIVGVSHHKYVPYEELIKMVDVSTGETQLMITLLLTTGARLSEVCSLKYRDFTIESDGTISVITPTLKQRKHQERELNIKPEWAVEIIKTALNGVKDKDENIWNLTADALRERVYTVAKQAGLSGVSPHTFRHALATHLLTSKGASPGGVQKVLGHKSLQTTSIYSHGGKKEVKETMALQ